MYFEDDTKQAPVFYQLSEKHIYFIRDSCINKRTCNGDGKDLFFVGLPFYVF